MTKPRDPEALLSAYLEEGMTVLPDRVTDAVLEDIHRTRQRTVFGPRRTRSMFRPALAAAAVVAMLVLGGAFLIVAGGLSPAPSAEPRPSLRGVVAPSSSLSAPSAAPTPSAVTSPSGIWIATGWMGTPRHGHTAVRLLDGRVLVAGGSGGPQGGGVDFEIELTSAELYDPDSGTWSATGNMLKPHAGFPATLLPDGKVLVGDVDDPAAEDSVTGAEVYDPESGTWTATGRMVWSNGRTATLLRDGRVLVSSYDGSELYDPDRGTWTATGKMTNPRRGHAAVLLADGRVLVAGGDDRGDDPTDSAELYDPGTGSWTAIANMHAAREFIEAFLQPDGKVLVVGGSGSGGPQSVELYDPATGAWTAIGDASSGGAYQTATLLADGTVLLAGGMNGTDAAQPLPFTLAELYDPRTGSWTTAAPMLRWQSSDPATLLLDGTVLVAGGIDCSPDSTGCPIMGASGLAELYVPRGVSPPTLPVFPSPTPRPIPSPTPSPAPIPPQAGPVPPGGRPWQVTVVNKSSKPATLFVAEEDESGMGQLVGSVTPNVVAPGATVKVMFTLPATGSRGWWIFVNPAPGTGALLGWDEVPRAGEIRIGADGQAGWLGP